ncbi:hypothetical protein G6F57_010140 [Rhizopus arrhizus]|uniref:Uncharacterized protein n=1 Tax=Rhizopus oryzae TaxID=64495 RepID=A0A9P6XCK0_RHIOR|nr:hypothetical protein G6F23_008946 [Rhizopus arrhizus]KAG1415800.1 hypothetical protein G6F58_006302 [Rhizopus delemar]KAG0764177.1 hypothetical protein G6F24_005426 [Rhizopus arrhizus]KAG0784032.1 hypothetical protein G6F21_010167 [Rhizopus arrhizus]KAG0786523.1 hypothetical protein G6F22_007600 [Rhizopus arrhizus]
MINKEPLQIYNTWRNRFTLSLRAKALADSKINFTIHAFDAAQKATHTAGSSTGQINSNLLVGGETSNTAFNDVENEDMSWASMKDDDELKFHYIAHKKAESGCNAEEQKYLMEFKSDGTPRSDLYKLSAKLLLKDKLTFQEDALLTLSGIYNYFHPFTTAMYTTHLNRPVPPRHTCISNKELNPDLTTMLSKIISNNDINEILATIQEEKAKLSKARQRHSDLYAMLSIIEKVMEDTEYWSSDQSEQEITFYRRFTSLLDALFNNCDIKMADGETGCESSRKQIEVNKRLFNTDDISPSYPRKIDLLLKHDDKRNIELCSNEWKRAKVTKEIKAKQQSKNLRVNASIIHNLQSEHGRYFDTILAMDIIGSKGYIYSLTKHEDYFVAASHSTIVIPMKISDISFLKSSLASLFSFKLREKIMQHEISHDLDDVWIIEHDNQLQNNANLIYFESKKRKSIDDNNDDYQSKRGSGRT